MWNREASSISIAFSVDGAIVGARDGFEDICHPKLREVSSRVRFHNSNTFARSPSGLAQLMLVATRDVISMNGESSVSWK